MFGGVSSGVAVPNMTKQTKQQHYADYLTAELKISCDAGVEHNARVFVGTARPETIVELPEPPARCVTALFQRNPDIN